MRVLSPLIAVCLATTSPAWAQHVTGNTFYKICDPEPGSATAEPSLCIGYMRGIMDGMVIGVATDRYAINQEPPGDSTAILHSIGLCVSENANYGQYRDITMMYLREHPGERHWDAPTLIYLALAQAFPC